MALRSEVEVAHLLCCAAPMELPVPVLSLPQMKLPEVSVSMVSQEMRVEARRPPETVTPPVKVEVPVPRTARVPVAERLPIVVVPEMSAPPWTESACEGEVVPMPRKLVESRRMASVSPAAVFLM